MNPETGGWDLIDKIKIGASFLAIVLAVPFVFWGLIAWANFCAHIWGIK